MEREKPQRFEHYESLRGQNAKIGSIALDSEIDVATSNNDTSTFNPEKVARHFIKRHGQQLGLFARDSSLSFEPSPAAETFSFHPKEFKVEMPLKWFASEEYTENELDFANHHELAHFIDMRKNPEAYLENFDRMEQKAETLAKQYLQKHPGRAPLDSVKKFYHRQIHALYNTLDDIYVNNLVFNRNKFFDFGDGEKAVETLYEKLGFGERDLTDQPLHTQMTMSLLRDEMLGGAQGKSIVDEQVENVLSKKKLGKSIRELIDLELKPRRGILLDPAERYQKIRNLIEPEYLELLEDALDDQEQDDNKAKNREDDNTDNSGKDAENGEGSEENNENSKDNQDNESSKSNDFDPFGDNKKSVNILDHSDSDEQVIKDILNSFKEADEVARMSPREREKYQTAKRVQEFDQEYNISKAEREENDEIQAKIKKARQEMRKFWRQLVGRSIEYRQAIIHGQRKGKLNINSVIDKYPDLIDSQRKGDFRDLEIYDRVGLGEKIIDQPDTIDISLLIDCSGSMNGLKTLVAKEAAALLMYSIKDFNDELERTRRETKSKLRANSEIIVFGSDFAKIKNFDRETNYDGNDAAIIKAISKIDSDHGNTNDASPLESILASLSSEERLRIKQGKLKKIVFEITDGQPDDPGKTAERISTLAREGVIMVGFQIGEVSEYEKVIFQTVWANRSGEVRKQGIFVGRDVTELPNKLINSLADLLNSIRV